MTHIIAATTTTGNEAKANSEDEISKGELDIENELPKPAHELIRPLIGLIGQLAFLLLGLVSLGVLAVSSDVGTSARSLSLGLSSPLTIERRAPAPRPSPFMSRST